MASNQEQMGQNVNYHKRIAMGAALDGSSMGGNQPAKSTAPAKSSRGGALAQAKKK